MEQRNATKLESAKLQPFEMARKTFATAGITPNLVDQSYPFNGTILYGFVMLVSAIYCTSIFIIHDAETFGEYTQSVCAYSFVILVIFSLLIVVLKVKKLYELINSFDVLVNTSECTLPLELLKYHANFAIYL